MKNTIIGVLVVVVIGLGIYLMIPKENDENITQYQNPNTNISQNTQQNNQVATTTPKKKEEFSIGKSVENRDIMAYQYGEGDEEIIFIAGIHGGYEWNTSMLAFEVIDYLKANQTIIPDNLKITIIPVLNPDGLYETTGKASRFDLSDIPVQLSETISGRFNANEVDLNRNFDCDWQSTSTWQSRTVSGGDEVFSEPESQAVRNYIENNKPKAVVVWYSAAGGVYSSSCHNGVSTETRDLTKIYANASGYTSYEEFDSYNITGDMVNWLASENIPAISVLLTNHNDIELEENKAGIKAILNQYKK